jgi:hypothetical protein
MFGVEHPGVLLAKGAGMQRPSVLTPRGLAAAAWSTCLDLGGNHAGVVSAAMNTSGQVGSVLSPLMVTFLLGRSVTGTRRFS